MSLRPSSAIPLRLFVFALLVVLTVPRMAQRGMFGDGLLYATISRNLSIGVGSFWAPTYTRTVWDGFFEHPPLGFALEAAAFWLLGDHPAVERLFSLLVLGAQALVIAAIWRRLHPADRDCDWLPVLFWLVPSIVTWGAINNMLENTQALFTSVAVLLLVSSRAASTRGAIVRSAAAGFAIVGAVLTKGPVGFFPLAAPLLFQFLRDEQMPSRPRRMRTSRGLEAPAERQMLRGLRRLPELGRLSRLWLMMTTLVVTVALCGGALAAYPRAREGLTEYVRTQLVPSLYGQREINREPLAVVRHLSLGIVGRMTALLVLCWAIARRSGRTHRGRDSEQGSERGSERESQGPSEERPGRQSGWQAGWPSGSQSKRRSDMARLGPALCFLALGLCASAPIALSPKLAGHYFLPSVPIFALGFASLAIDAGAALSRARSPWGRRGPYALAAGMLAFAVLVPLLYGPLGRRDAALLREIEALAPVMPRGLTIGTCRHPRAALDWGLHSYVQRMYRVSLEARDAPVNGWLLRADEACAVPPGCEVAAGGETLRLYRCALRVRDGGLFYPRKKMNYTRRLPYSAFSVGTASATSAASSAKTQSSRH